jgi:branched-chain amino acid transport system ATP-binding protein
MLALGVSLVPQQRHLFPNFTVLENIRAGGYARRQHEGVLEAQQDKVLELFPTLRVLGNTKASSLSGGEQQMVAVARAMMTAPKVLLLDEPSHGLAPMVVADLVRTLSQMVEHDGGSVIIAEQNAEAVASIADRYLLLDATAAPRNLSRAEATTSEMAAAYFGRTRKEHDDK